MTVPPDERLRRRVQALLADLRWFGLAQVQFQISNPGEPFLIDLNGPLYILDKATKKLTTYLDFNGFGERNESL